MQFEYDDHNRLVLPLNSYHLTYAFIEALGFNPDLMLAGDNGVSMSLISLTSPQTIEELQSLVEQYHPYFAHWLASGKCIFNDILHAFVLAYDTITSKASKHNSGVNWNETLPKTFELLVELVQEGDIVKPTFTLNNNNKE